MDSNVEQWSRKKTYGLLGLAILLAAAIRLYLAWQYYCISSDGVHYIDAAKDFFAGRTAEGLQSVYPPAYPFLIASIYPVVGDWEIAGQVWSVLSGVLVLVPLYLLCRKIYGERVALVACFLAAAAPYLARYSAHVRTESVFILLSTISLLVFSRAIQALSLKRFFFGGVIAGLAYLVRPESIGFVAIVPLILGIQHWIKRERRVLWLCMGCLLLLVGFVLLAAPYVVYLRQETGQWALSRKAGVTLWVSLKERGFFEGSFESIPDHDALNLVEFARSHPALYAKKFALDLFPSVGVYLEAMYYSYIPFLLVGLFQVARESFWKREDFLLLVFVLFHIVGFALIYVNLRYAVQLVPASMGWTAMGIVWCWDELKKITSAKTFKRVTVLFVVVFLVATLPKALKAISPEKAHVREAGRYLKTLKRSGELTLLVFDDRIAFYAEAKPILLSALGEQGLLSYLKDGKAQYLATETGPWKEWYPSIASNPERYGLVLEKEFHSSGKGELLLFKVRQEEKT